MYSAINFHELSATTLCEYIEVKFHARIRLSLSVVKLYINNNYPCNCNCSTQFSLIGLLFSKLEEEVEAIFKKEEIVLFPLIKEHEHRHIATQLREGFTTSLENYHRKIVQMLDKLHKLSHNYIVHFEAAPEKKLCVEELFYLQQELLDWMRLEESVLFPKIKTVANHMADEAFFE